MNIALHALGKVVVNDLHDPLEIHAPSHHLRAYHDPTFTPPHPPDRVFSFLFRHTRVKTIHVRNVVDH